MLESKRLAGVRRSFDPFVNRKGIFRLDRNEDADGWDDDHLQKWLNQISSYDISAYADSGVLASRIAEWCGVGSDGVTVTAGSDAGIKLIFETYLDPGDKVLVLDPSWRMYDVWTSVYQATLLTFPFRSDLTLDLGLLEAEIQKNCPRLVVIANPNQPTGTALDVHELRLVSEMCRTAGSILVIDEAYHLFSDVSATELLSENHKVLVVRTFSKAFGLAGLRLGYILGSKERAEELRILRPVADASSLSINAGLFSLQNIAWVYDRIDGIRRGRDFLIERLRESGLRIPDSAGNFVVVSSSSEFSAAQCVSRCLEVGYAIKGPIKVGPLGTAVRISVASMPTMKLFWQECGEFFSHLQDG